MAINLSAAQFSEPQLVEKIRAQLEQSGVSPQWLELELTEIAAMKNPTVAAQTMAQLSELGLSLSIDDFGTGYSSLSHLKRFDIYKLKIDQSFVRDVVDDPEDQAIVTAIINMAHSLGMITLAEGVETPEHARAAREAGCHALQGYLYARPMPLAGLIARLATPTARAQPRRPSARWSGSSGRPASRCSTRTGCASGPEANRRGGGRRRRKAGRSFLIPSRPAGPGRG